MKDIISRRVTPFITFGDPESNPYGRIQIFVSGQESQWHSRCRENYSSPPPLTESTCRVLHDSHDMHMSAQGVMLGQQPCYCPRPRLHTWNNLSPSPAGLETRAHDYLRPCSTFQCLVCSLWTQSFTFFPKNWSRTPLQAPPSQGWLLPLCGPAYQPPCCWWSALLTTLLYQLISH